MSVLVHFRCGSALCAIDRAHVAEIAPVTDFSRPPGLPAMMEGFLNLGGEALPVVEGARLFGLAPDVSVDPLYRHVLVLDDGVARLGLLVDRAEAVVSDAGAERRQEPARVTLNGCVEADLTIDDRTVHLLAAERILLAAERARLAALSQVEQARIDATNAI